MAAIGGAIAVAAVVRKRRMAPHFDGSPLRRFFVAFALYFVTASLGWFFLIGWVIRRAAEIGWPIPGPVASLCVVFGAFVIARLVLPTELREIAKSAPRRQ
jgi:hypothetical protein